MTLDAHNSAESHLDDSGIKLLANSLNTIPEGRIEQ